MQPEERPQSLESLGGKSLQIKLKQSISFLNLSNGAYRALTGGNIGTIAMLVSKTERDLLAIPHLAFTRLREIKRRLHEIDLSLGMVIDDDKQLDHRRNDIAIAVLPAVVMWLSSHVRVEFEQLKKDAVVKAYALADAMIEAGKEKVDAP